MKNSYMQDFLHYAQKMCAEMRDNMAVEMTLPELEANISWAVGAVLMALYTKFGKWLPHEQMNLKK